MIVCFLIWQIICVLKRYVFGTRDEYRLHREKPEDMTRAPKDATRTIKENKENSDFWESKLEGIDMDGIRSASKLSPTCREVIRQTYNAIRGRERFEGIFVCGHIDIRASIIEFSRKLGATEREIELDILPSLGL